MQCNSIRGLILYSMMPGSLLDIENVLLYAPLWQLALGGLIVVLGCELDHVSAETSQKPRLLQF